MTNDINSLSVTPSSSTQLYVVPFSSLLHSDSNGSFERPYSSLRQAFDHIERDYYNRTTSKHRTTINLYPTHHFVDTIQFRLAHSHTRLTTMNAEDTTFYAALASHEHTRRKLPTASISGGVPVTGWTHISGNTYSAVVPQPIFVNQLQIRD